MPAYIGQPVRRVEDERLLSGRGTYVADIKLPGMLEAAMLRSLHAYARVKAIDTRWARVAPGVIAVFTHADFADVLKPLPVIFPHPALHARTQLPLAKDRVRYVGEILAVVVARDRYAAEDACERIEVEYEPLPAVVDLCRAADPTSTPVHEDLGHNIAAELRMGFGDFESARRNAYRVLEAEFTIGRCSGSPLETRGVIAEYRPWNPGLKLTAWSSTQAPHTIRRALAGLLGMTLDEVRVIAPDVGGGFGSKAPFYAEEYLIPLVAMRLGQPVRWIEDRREHFATGTQEREQIHRVQLAVDHESRILGIRDDLLSDGGAYSWYGVIVPFLSASMILGPYRVPSFDARARMIYTNKVPVSPYRGAGRPQATFVMERMLDLAARELGVDRAEIRRRNFIQPHEFPYPIGLTGRDGTMMTYDSGNYPGNLEMALTMLGYDRERAEAERARKEGRAVGIGIACTVENSGLGPFEGAIVRVDPSGTVFVITGATSQGQGQATSLAQVCAETLGVNLETVKVVMGDTAQIPMGVGALASRLAVVAGSAVSLAAKAVREKALRLAAERLEVSPDDLEIHSGRVGVRGFPQRSVTLGELAWDAIGPYPGDTFPLKGAPGLEATEYFAPERMTYASAVHTAVVEVDRDTGAVRILRYVVVHDCGRILNPMIVDGQVHGGVVNGIGNALLERIVYAETGQLMTASFMDYLLPSAADVPAFEVGHMETLSPLNPLGAKGAGEAGTMPVPAAICSAVDDALGGRTFATEFPLQPERILELLDPSGKDA